MKFVIISDIHFGPGGMHRSHIRPTEINAGKILERLVEKINSDVKPNFVIILGDLIEDFNQSKDKQNLKLVLNLLSELDCECYFVAGNHDTANISEEELTRIFGYKKLYYSYDRGDYHFIALHSKKSNSKQEKIELPAEQLKWLKSDLDSTKKRNCCIYASCFI